MESGQKRKTWDAVLDVDSSSTKSGRRPSVDTVSTYLSHENPVDLLDSSVGSDDAFKDSVLGTFRAVDGISCTIEAIFEGCVRFLRQKTYIFEFICIFLDPDVYISLPCVPRYRMLILPL